MRSHARTTTAERDEIDELLRPEAPEPWGATWDGVARTPELRWRASWPTVILLGPNPLVPYRPGLKHAPGDPDAPPHAVPFDPRWAIAPECERPAPGDWPAASCPLCGGTLAALAEPGAAALKTYCPACHSRDPINEHALEKQREAASRDRAERQVAAKVREADAAFTSALESERPRGAPTLTELERRRIWQGYRPGSLLCDPSAVDTARVGIRRVPVAPTERALAGRAWLASIDQLPRWELILDRRGNVLGRYEWDEGAGEWVARLDEAQAQPQPSEAT